MKCKPVLFLIPIILLWHNLTIWGQVPFNKEVDPLSLSHTKGKHLVDVNGVRFGGCSNMGAQEQHRVRKYIFDHPTIANVQGSVIFDEFIGTPGTCGVHVHNLPWGANPQYTGSSLTCAQVWSVITPWIQNNLNNVVLAADQTSADYDLLLYKATMQFELSNAVTIGTEFNENPPYLTTDLHNTFAAFGNDYYLATLFQRITYGPSEVGLAKVRDDHSLAWMNSYDYYNGDRPTLVQVFPNGISLLAVRNGWANTYFFTVDAYGNVLAANQFEIVHSTGNWSFTPAAMVVNPSNATEMMVIGSFGHPYGAGTIHRMVFAKLDQATLSPTILGQYDYDDFILAPSCIKALPGDAFLVSGNAIDMTSNTSEGFPFIMKINANGSYEWANKFTIGADDRVGEVVVRNDGKIWAAGDAAYDVPSGLGLNGRNFTMTRFKSDGQFDNGFGQPTAAWCYRYPGQKTQAYLLQPATGEHLLDGYFEPSSGKINRFLIKTKPNGEGLLCNSKPTDPSVNAISFNLYNPEAKAYPIRVSDITKINLTPSIQSLSIPVDESGCETCNCE